jgi:hypothetical protein
MNPIRRARIFGVAGVALLLLAGGRHADLVARRGADNLQFVAPEDTTPLVAMTTVAFGAFRGLVADVLWVRAAELQENGQYFELVQLATWISQLEPTIPEVWEFQAWNLAYNISVLFSEPEDRWRWVAHGLDLLRHDGLRNNPVSPVLHWNIGWMFQHKIGMDFDQAHLFYKAELARKAEAAFSHPDGLREVERVFRMRPESMGALEETFGPLDWRIPATHSLYWADRGLGVERGNRFQARNLQRMRLHSLAQLLMQGELLIDSDGAPLLALPRFELTDRLLAELERLDADPLFGELTRRSMEMVLMEAILLHAEYGRSVEALALYGRLTRLNVELLPGPEGLLNLLAQSRLEDDPAHLSRDQAMIRLTALLVQAREWDGRDEARARGYRSMARQIHRRYHAVRTSPEHLERTGVPSFDAMDRAVQARLPAGATI